LAEEIRARRLAKNWTQQTLADACKVAKAHISKLERDAGAASGRLLLRVAEVLDVNLTFAKDDIGRVREGGITDCAASQGELPQLLPDMRAAKHVSLLLARGSSVLGAQDALLRDVLKQKGRDTMLRILLLNPGSQFVAQLAERAALDPDEIREGVRRTLEIVHDLGRPKVACRLYDEFPVWRLLFAGEVVYAGTYRSKFLPTSGASITHYRIEKKEAPLESLFLGFEAHFDSVWNRAKLPMR